MSPKLKRGTTLASLIAILGLAAWLILDGLNQHVVFFYGPSDIHQQAQPDRKARLGGLVAVGSVTQAYDQTRFAITDGNTSVAVVYVGILPDLFGEGQGVVTEGILTSDGVFQASRVLAKHDETYMPPEVAEILKAQGVWRGP